MHDPTVIEVDLAAIVRNLGAIRGHVGDGVQIMPVVKANAYGHGAVEVARVCAANGADRLAVARVAEGIALRAEGITLPINVLSYGRAAEMEAVVAHDLVPAVGEISIAQALAESAQAAGKVARLHIKVDTGMGRFGLPPDEVLPFVKLVLQMTALEIEGIFTHFGVADSVEEEDRAYTRKQIETFNRVVDGLQQADIDIAIRHAANSAATMYYPDAHYDLVRPGISLYGLRPNRDLDPAFELSPALSLKSRVARVKTLPAGMGIGYGRTVITQREMPVALIPVGYGDGYHRLMSNRGAALINGIRVPIVGRVSMDQIIVDVSEAGAVQVDDEVVLLGAHGGERITADDIACWAETINYEVTTSLLARLPRIYRD
jgi:alanine racemase